MPPTVKPSLLLCKKCSKEVVLEKVCCSACKAIFHTGCANAYIRLRNSDKCCATNLALIHKVNSFIPKQRESTRRKLERANIFSERRDLSPVEPESTETVASAEPESIVSVASAVPVSIESVASGSSVVASSSVLPASSGNSQSELELMTMSHLSQLPQGWETMSADERQTHQTLIMLDVKAEVSSMKSDLHNLKSSVQAQAESLAVIEQQNVYLAQENTDLKKLFAFPPSSELRIAGIPNDIAISDDDACKSLLRHLDLSTLEGSILSVRTVKQKNTSGGNAIHDTQTRAIIVKFSSTQIRDYVVETAKSKGQITTEQVFAGTKVKLRVFVSEFLPRVAMDLYMKAKARKNEVGFKHVWVKSGKIFARREDGSEIIPIVTESDLEKMQ